ncbi:MAG: DUF4013 domain-containing protein [Actinobacteria bacterium]|nr:DUF4013 domain-containing protein [Actinomycetota bacterium]
MDLSRALNAPFKDRDWVVKVLLGGLWGLLIVTIPAQLGAMMAYVRSVANDDESLPAWSNFGSKWVSGFLLLVGTTIYMLPAIVLSGVIMAGAAAAIASQDPYAAAAVAGTGLLLGLLSLIWMIVASLPLSAAMVNYSITGQFSSMFAIGYLIKLIRSRTGFFKAWGLSLLIGVVAGITVSALSMLLIGYILAPWIYFLSYIFSAHLFGQWAKAAMSLGQADGQVNPPAPPPAPFVAPQAPPPEPAPPATPAPPEEPKPPSPPQ